ncbi:hypothetical protein [Halopiger goleimassiliensis]|uniref:hypothetical protein n=1 Tax=Halopiger goleimassiliensis TaxID=1293048 RepID=UPI000677A682|nr:hypothetical protein [Halopiger goleimassiliensis]
MKTLEVTDEQYEYIQKLREEIAADVVGKYGFVREQDAVQFLIDNLADEVDLDVDVESSAADDVAASVGAAIDGDPDPNELEEITYDETAETDPGSDGDASDADVDDSVPDDSGDDVAGSSTDEADDETDDESDDGDGEGGAADDDDMLDEMMSLLETHNDKWEESDSADYRYTVTLPDGSTEDVQTKDDVRALLFKNYR